MAAVYQVGGSLHCQARMDKQRNAQKSRRYMDSHTLYEMSASSRYSYP